MTNLKNNICTSIDLFDKNYIRFSVDGEDYICLVHAENDFALNPREENASIFSSMVCWHRRYNLGDKHSYDDPYDFLRDLIYEQASMEQLHKTTASGKTNLQIRRTDDGFALYDIDDECIVCEEDAEDELFSEKNRNDVCESIIYQKTRQLCGCV